MTLLPFVRQSSVPDDGRSAPSDSDSNVADEHEGHSEYSEITSWLERLPSIVRSGGATRDPGAVSLDVLRAGGIGLRWDPEAELWLPFPAANGRIGHRLAPGAIWFPVAYADELSDTGEFAGPWLECPAIIARNGDVMRWVDKVLRGLQQNDGLFPAEIVMGALGAGTNKIERVGAAFPFSSGPGGPDEVSLSPAHAASPPYPSTVDALNRVEYLAGFDLEGERAYENLDIKRVFLVKRPSPKQGDDRSVILIFDADLYDMANGQDIPVDAAMGYLRPVQRYVLQAGLDRAIEINNEVLDKLEDKWGFAQVRKGEAPKLVSVTPPIIEQLHPDDWESEDGKLEFIICDGNHRVVQRVWKEERTMPAVAVLGTPRQPYYARPFSKFEWHYTAATIPTVAPDDASKYSVRDVDVTRLLPSAKEKLDRIPKRLHYRRYFRDLSTGFGYMGGQGGRYV